MSKKFQVFLLLLMMSICNVNAQIWKDSNAPVDARVNDLLSRLTLDEKISFCGSRIPAVDRLGIPAFEWYAEALHGIIGWNCTQFPQNIAMGCTWNPDLMFDVATAISNEARALNNLGKKEVMMFSPTVNMARDPRWGRNEECYSEDPFLMSEMARMYVRGMQGNDSHYIKTVTTVKHFVANNVDKNRERIHSYINKKDLYEYYFPAYKTCIVDEGATGIMTALNGLNGIPCSAHTWLVNDVLRKQWGFKGYVIADWTAVQGIAKNMHYVSSQAEAAATAIKAGVDQECFRNNIRRAPMVEALKPAIEQGLLSETELDVAVGRLLRLRFLTGEFDSPDLNPYTKIPAGVLECETHKKLALKAAEQSIVLLKNDRILPLKSSIKELAVIGPFANRCWTGIYSGNPQSKVSPLDGIKEHTKANVHYAKGCSVTADSLDQEYIDQAVELAKKVECVILLVGNDESTSTENLDRKSLNLPGNQHQLIKAIQKVNKNVVLVLVPSGPTAISWEQKHIRGIVCAWPNGQEQGTALANVLFGDVNPGGKLCSTWYRSERELPDIHDYNIQKGRTYMYFKGQALYPFGYGLSYTQFTINGLLLSKHKVKKMEGLTVNASVRNVGTVDGDEVVQVYVRSLQAKQKSPMKALKGFRRVNVKAGQLKKVSIRLPYEAFAYYDTLRNSFVVDSGRYEVLVGNSSANIFQKQELEIDGAVLPPLRVGQKSGYYIADDKNRKKNWDFLYANKNSLKDIKKQDLDEHNWVEYELSFTDPGFYVNTWDAELFFRKVSKDAKIEISMAGSKINTYKIHDQKHIAIKIPIPPEYGKPVRLRLKTLQGNIVTDALKIIPPDGSSPLVIHKVVARSKVVE